MHAEYSFLFVLISPANLSLNVARVKSKGQPTHTNPASSLNFTIFVLVMDHKSVKKPESYQRICYKSVADWGFYVSLLALLRVYRQSISTFQLELYVHPRTPQSGLLCLGNFCLSICWYIRTTTHPTYSNSKTRSFSSSIYYSRLLLLPAAAAAARLSLSSSVFKSFFPSCLDNETAEWLLQDWHHIIVFLSFVPALRNRAGQVRSEAPSIRIVRNT